MFLKGLLTYTRTFLMDHQSTTLTLKEMAFLVRERPLDGVRNKSQHEKTIIKFFFSCVSASGASCAGAISGLDFWTRWHVLKFSSCLEVSAPVCKSTPFSSRALCSASSPGVTEGNGIRGKHQWLSGKLSSNKVLIRTVCASGGGGRGSISLG